jgi:hypothetical protein
MGNRECKFLKFSKVGPPAFVLMQNDYGGSQNLSWILAFAIAKLDSDQFLPLAIAKRQSELGCTGTYLFPGSTAGPATISE